MTISRRNRLPANTRAQTRPVTVDPLDVEIERAHIVGKWALWTALASAVTSGVLSFGGVVVDVVNPPSPTSETRTICTSAYENVEVAVDLGIEKPDLLEKINSEDVDEKCGEESEIALDLKD